MLSYRHGFHAGNHADVLKHMVLCLILRHLNAKDKPYCILDTHAGGGLYDLTSQFATKNCEFETGAYKILKNRDLQKVVPEFFNTIKTLNADKGSNITLYPGSPMFEAMNMRETDRLYLTELHKAEIESLERNFKKDRRVHIFERDGLEVLKAMLPPTPHRGLVVIDPSYEVKSDYIMLVKALKEAFARYPIGIYAIWYPVLGKMSDHSKRLVQDIKRLNLPLLQVELCVEKQQDEIGMCGSGMLIVNYPYGIENELDALMGPLYKALASNEGSGKLRILNEKA